MDQFWRFESIVLADRLARGSVYCLLGLTTMTFIGRTIAGPQDVLRLLHDMQGATFLHSGLAIALMIFGACRSYCAAFGKEYSPGRLKDEAVRFMRMGCGVAAFLLGAIVLGSAVDGLDGSVSLGRYGAEVLLGIRVGGAWLTAIGLLLFTAAACQIANAWRTDPAKRLAPDVPIWVVPLQGAGLAARAEVSFIIGYAFVRAGMIGAPLATAGFDDVLSALVENTELNILLVFALFLSGIQSFAEARWRKVVSRKMKPAVSLEA